MSHIVVIGAGVIGLQTAVSLLEAGYKVTIIAKHFPGEGTIEYTSPWAGAQWRTHATADQKDECEWDISSYKQWAEVAQSDPEKAKEMGIETYPSYFYWATETPESTSPSKIWFGPHILNFSVLPATSLPPNTHAGIRYTSIAINPPKYISYLLNHATSLGATLIHSTLPTPTLAAALTAAETLLSQQFPQAPPISAFINCTGLGARVLVPDALVHPIRGQTLLAKISGVDSPAQKSENPVFSPSLSVPAIHTREDVATPSVTYIIPRPGTDTWVLGGTKEVGNWSAEADAGTTEGILKRCCELWPALQVPGVEIEVLATQVGLRPGRTGGARVEVEEVEGRVVVHEYGHAGAGFQNSVGSAAKVLGLLEGRGI
ncbi:FAD dependent oxidoreductase [Mytilinidion resinicola]|uniref:FAD dependent oxidoreductase n=1 Tax=Mytilinidion resinicola TaxID=574789 RepID=A0A6A6Y6Y2_9PEZI|nr:FAD dependent oxidoreductase [Mytilinidion resinicola]KAF2803567.1 FAD dependent oxidoreductase [Mytilinidion resinicola]